MVNIKITKLKSAPAGSKGIINIFAVINVDPFVNSGSENGPYGPYELWRQLKPVAKKACNRRR